MVDWGDPEAFWLNVTNAVLGLVTIIAFALVVSSVGAELLQRWRRKVRDAAGEIHLFEAPLLGPTMADGGRKLKDREAERDEGGPTAG